MASVFICANNVAGYLMVFSSRAGVVDYYQEELVRCRGNTDVSLLPTPLRLLSVAVV